VGEVGFTVICLVSGELQRLRLARAGKITALATLPEGLELDQEVGVGILVHMALRALEAVLGGLMAKMGIRINRVPVHVTPVHVIIVIITVAVFLLQAKEVHPGTYRGWRR